MTKFKQAWKPYLGTNSESPRVRPEFRSSERRPPEQCPAMRRGSSWGGTRPEFRGCLFHHALQRTRGLRTKTGDEKEHQPCLTNIQIWLKRWPSQTCVPNAWHEHSCLQLTRATSAFSPRCKIHRVLCIEAQETQGKHGRPRISAL